MRELSDIRRRGLPFRCFVLSLFFCQFLTMAGCAALVAPIHGVDANMLDHSFSLPSKSGQKTIDLSALRQVPPPEHLVDSGDVLGVFIEGILGKLDDVPPIYQPASTEIQPSVGYPVTILANGTIALPLIDPVPVRGLTIQQVQQTVTEAYVRGQRAMLQPNQARIMITLQRPRTYRVLVIRQESDNRQGNLGASEVMNFEQDKQGTGRVVQLPAYQNDVLHALAHTGGLPGLDAQNMIYVIRKPRHGQQRENVWQETSPVYRGQSPDSAVPMNTVARQGSGGQPVSDSRYSPGFRESSAVNSGNAGSLAINARYGGSPGHGAGGHSFLFGPASSDTLSRSRPESSSAPAAYSPSMAVAAPLREMHGVSHSVQASVLAENLAANRAGAFPGETQIICIPVRSFPGEPLPFCPDDVVLYDGDVVFIESRETEFFYTGGLLGGGQYTLPRDYDITILDAVSIAEARSGQAQGSARSVGGASVLNQDVSIGASRAVISRPLPEGGHLKIEVNLSQAMNDPHQQVIIRPGDRIYLRYTRPEAVLAFFERFILEGTVWGYSNNAFRDN